MTKSTSIASKKSNRILGLDALRGFAILLMVLSGVIAYRILPAWMYHAQVPPPNHVFNPNLPGFTWVDLVFPLFLFSTAAAFPIALRKYEINKIEGLKRIVSRFFYLSAFAILLQHVRPGNLGSDLSDPKIWWFALCGFGLLFLMYTRWPSNWNLILKRSLSLLGWIGMITFVFLYEFPKNCAFDIYRSDIILIVLADMALVGSIIWLFTFENTHYRYLILVVYAALRLSSTEDSWIQTVWNYSPIPWLIKWDYLKYLFIVIPGMFAGEYLLKAKKESIAKYSFSKMNIVLMLVFVQMIVLFVGLQMRFVFETSMLSFVICTALIFISKKTWGKESAIYKLTLVSIAWLCLGLILEPYSGGIKKDPSSFSYWMITSGLSGLLLICFYSIMDVKSWKTPFNWLIGNGQNPMIAYVAFGNVIWPILVLTGWESSIIQVTQSPFTGFLRGVFYTFLVAAFTYGFVKLKLHWKT